MQHVQGEQAFPVRIYRFFTKYPKLRVRKPDGSFQVEIVPTDYVEYGQTGIDPNRSTTVARVKDIIERVHVLEPGSNNEAVKLANLRAAMVRQAYQAWKDGRQAPVNGTPLDVWPGVTPEQADVLRSLGLNSVELIRDMSDSVIARIPFPGARDLKVAAGYFLGNYEKSQSAEKLAAVEKDNAELREQLEEMRQMVLEMQAAQGRDAGKAPAKGKARTAKGKPEAEAEAQEAAA